MKKTMPAAQLVLDYNFYPRQHIDESNVRAIRASVLAGEKLPAVVADAGSLRVIDGFHRVTQALRADAQATIVVDLLDYANEQEMFLDAVRRNSRHGARLTSYDQARVVSIAEDWKITKEKLAEAMAIPLGRVGEIRLSRIANSRDGRKLQVKRPFRNLAGTVLTDAQENANRRSSGWPASFHADQIVILLDAEQIDLEEEHTRSSLEALYNRLAPLFGLSSAA